MRTPFYLDAFTPQSPTPPPTPAPRPNQEELTALRVSLWRSSLCLPPFIHKTPGTLLPAFVDENHSFLEPISYFCFNRLVSFVAGKTPIILTLSFFSFSWNTSSCIWEPKSLLSGDLGLLSVAPGSRVGMPRGWRGLRFCLWPSLGDPLQGEALSLRLRRIAGLLDSLHPFLWVWEGVHGSVALLAIKKSA